MKDKSKGFNVNFSIKNITLKQQQDFYEVLLKYTPFNLKDNLEITVQDPVDGLHNIWDNTGITPNGKLCKKCNMINCEECSIYIMEKSRNESNEK